MPASNPHVGRRVLALLLATAATAAGALAGCGASTPATRPGVIDVVAAENVWGDIIGQIGGSHVSVTSIITDPNADPHTYETDPRDAAAVGNAAFVVENGAGYDDFVDRLLSVGGVGSRDVLNLTQAVGAGANPNPHLWYNPVFVTRAADAIEAHLALHDTADARVFEANLRSFLASYQPYVDAVATIKSRYAGSPIGYTERVPGYLVTAAGLRLATPASFAQAIEDGNDPSPADSAAMDDAISQRRIKVLLYNSQVTSPVTQHVRDLATAGGVPVVGVAESIPTGEPSFQRWQLDQATAILAALGG